MIYINRLTCEIGDIEKSEITDISNEIIYVGSDIEELSYKTVCYKPQEVITLELYTIFLLLGVKFHLPVINDPSVQRETYTDKLGDIMSFAIMKTVYSDYSAAIKE